MIKSYLRLITFFAIQHQVLAEDRSVETQQGLHNLLSRRSTSSVLRSEILMAPRNAEEISKVVVDVNKNEKEIKPSQPVLITPVIKHGHHHSHHHHHHHHKAHSGKKNAKPTDNNSNTTVKINDRKELKDNIATANLKPNEAQTESGNVPPATQNTPFKVPDKEKVTPAVPFYRRINYLDEEERNKPQKWAHCLDLITPRLKGYKDDWKMNQQNSSNSDVMRLSQLLSVDVGNYTQEEIESILFQISNIRIRLFRWDYTALTTILNIIIPGHVHNFKTLKDGIRALFDSWHLDTTMMTTFLKQTRIFRPPCIETSGLEGSTQKAAGKRYTTPDQNKNAATEDYSPSCESEDDVNDNNDKPPN